MKYEKKLNIVDDKSKTQDGILLTDGRIISLYNKNNRFYLRWCDPIDLNTMTYESREANDDEVTINSIIMNGVGHRVTCYETCDYYRHVYPDDFKNQEQEDAEIDNIVKFFSEAGYTVDREAVRHNVDAWLSDYKSGYRDENGGYHLFSPCGCNHLSVRLTTLHYLCENWQQTYTC